MILAIKHFLESLKSYFSTILGTLLSIPKMILMSRLLPKYPEIQVKNAAILGNGPSLNDSLQKDFQFIKDTEIYCVNNFAAYPIFEELKPQNYVLLDPAFYQYSPSNNSHKIVEKTIHSFEKTKWKMNLFLPQSAKKSYLVETLSKNHFIQLNYFNYTILNGFPWWNHLFFNWNLGMPQCQNILAAALFIAIQRNHSTIYLFGGDHSWHEELRLEDNELITSEKHFYQKNGHTGKISDYPETVNRVYKIFQSWSKAFYSYEALANYAISKNIHVLNASTKSYIDTFKKINV